MVLHQTRASRRFLTTLTKFDPKSILSGSKNLNFNPAVRMGWNQRHCEDYQILIPMTIHRSKSELRQQRYHKNRDNTPINAPLTSKSHNFWSNYWIFKIHTFLETVSQDISRGIKIKPIGGLLKVAAIEGSPPLNLCQGYKKPQASFRLEGDHFLLGFSLYLVFLHIFPFFQIWQTHKKHPKTHQNFLILLSSSKT